MADRSDEAEAGSIIALIVILTFFWFLAYLRHRLQRAEGDDGWLTSVAFGGGLVTAVVFLVILSVELATTSIDANSPETQVAKTFFVYGWNYSLVFAPPMMALTAATSLVIVRHGPLSKWIGWLGFLVTLSLLLPWMGAPITLVWLFIVSTMLLIQALRAASPA